MLVFHRQKSGWPSDATTIETWPWRWITETWQREVASKCVPLAVTVACEGWSLVSGLIVCQGTVLFKSKLYEIQLNMSQMRCCFHYVDLGSAWLPTIIHVVGSNTQRWTVRLCDATVGVSPFSGGSWELRKTWQRVLCEECSSFCSFVFSCLFFYSIIVLMLLFVCSCLLVYVYCSFIVVCFFMFVFPFFRTSQVRSSSTSQESSKWTIRSHFGPMALVRRLAWVKKGHAWVWFTWTEQMFSEAKNRIVGKTFSARRRFCHGCALE